VIINNNKIIVRPEEARNVIKIIEMAFDNSKKVSEKKLH